MVLNLGLILCLVLYLGLCHNIFSFLWIVVILEFGLDLILGCGMVLGPRAGLMLGIDLILGVGIHENMYKNTC